MEDSSDKNVRNKRLSDDVVCEVDREDMLELWTFLFGVNFIINRENKFFDISPILQIFWLEDIFQNLFISMNRMYFAHKIW